jgi:hypothetical protein
MSRRISLRPNELAAKDPNKLKELQDLFMAEVVKDKVLPIDDRSIEQFDPSAGRRRDISLRSPNSHRSGFWKVIYSLGGVYHSDGNRPDNPPRRDTSM